MKKLILSFLLFCVLSSCSNFGKEVRVYEISYETLYPDTTVTYTNIVSTKVLVYANDTVYASSNRGTNFINICGHDHVGSTTCPIRLISYKRIK